MQLLLMRSQGFTRNLSKSLECAIYVTVTRSRCMLSEDVEKKHYARFDVSTKYS